MFALKDRRLGIFEITGILISHNPTFVKQVMGQCVILRADQRAEYDCIVYIAISDWFDEVGEGCLIPEYTIIANRDANGKIKWKFWPKDM